MMKALKRIFMVFMLLVLLAAGYIAAFAYSDELATDVAYLECRLSDDAGKDGALANGELVTIVTEELSWPTRYRLRKDWIYDRVLESKIADPGIADDGLMEIRYFDASPLKYESVTYESASKMYVYASYDRERLVRRWELREVSDGKAVLWYEEQCSEIDQVNFERHRQESVSATEKKQKI
jgi:hypothetical protein